MTDTSSTENSDSENATQRSRSIRLALMLGALAVTFYVGSFFFLTD